MSLDEFSSSLAPAICGLILQKRANGSKYIHGETLLRHFDRFCTKIGYVPLAHHRRDVLPRLGGEAPREDPQGRRTGTHPFSRPQTHFRHPRPAKRRRHQNGLQYAGPLRRGLHAPHLHPRHPAKAGGSSGNHRKLYGADHVKSD